MNDRGGCGPVDAGQWVEVAAAGDLAAGAALTSSAGDVEVAVFNLGDEIVAVEARCLHKGGALAEGHLRGDVVTCPLHWWRYDLRTGERLGAPDLRLACYPVRSVGGRIEVLMPSPRRTGVSLRERLLAAGRDWQAGGSQ